LFECFRVEKGGIEEVNTIIDFFLPQLDLETLRRELNGSQKYCANDGIYVSMLKLVNS